MNYIIGTRGSKLALAQAEYVCGRLREAYPEHSYEIKVIKTKGDRIQDRPLDQIGDKGLFVKEIEEQILSGEVQIGVHSMKDMPAVLAEGLCFTKAWKREDPRDVLILREKSSLEELPKGAVIGTGSKRRRLQIKRLRPDIECIDIRGNVDTRLRKMEEQRLDGIVLAAAGLHRLGLQERITQYLELEQMICAPAQGILALEIRAEDTKLKEMLDALSDKETDWMARAERGFLAEIGGDCHVPVGAVCQRIKGEKYRLRAVFGKRDSLRLAFAEVSGSHPEELAREAARAIQKRLEEPGRVYLVGGGPGDPELITVKGLKAIWEADCIVYDRLSSPELLEEAKPGCELIYVGKASHNHTMSQEGINELLVQKSQEYEKTVRLKGGDAYVFGRGGEEALELREHGVPFEVIPGISSSLAGLSYAGIPITHRGKATGFHVVTAHNQRDELADIDFEAMARGKDTCVFLMGLSKAGEIARRLLEAGMPPETEAAVISKATTAEQRTVTASLVSLEEELLKARLSSPALIVVGKVVGLREKLNFFEEQPLFGKKYLVTKVGKEVSRLTKLLESQGAKVDEIQTGRICERSTLFFPGELKKVNWLLFTSKNGVNAFFKSFRASGLDIRELSGCKIVSIGKKTSEALWSYGLQTDLEPEEFHSDALAEVLGKEVREEEFLWYIKAGNADGHLQKALEGKCRFREILLYENRAVELQLPSKESLLSYHGVFFTCASSAERLIKEAGAEVLQRWGLENKLYSIGVKTTERLKSLGAENCVQAGQATYEALAGCVLDRRE